MRKDLGLFEIGYEKVNLISDTEEYGGSFTFLPNDKSNAQIVIGIAHDRWMDVLKVILHEAFEFSSCRNKTRFSATEDLSDDRSEFVFMFNHPTLSHCCGLVAEFLYNINSKLYQEWEKLHKKGKKRG